MKLATLIVSAMALVPSFAASPSYWNAKGSGNWASESRWENGNVPQPGYQVRLTGATYANDADMAILAAAGQVVLPGSTSDCFTTYVAVAVAVSPGAMDELSSAPSTIPGSLSVSVSPLTVTFPVFSAVMV